MTTFPYEYYEESAACLRARLNGFSPKVLLILGSGLGYLAEQVENAITVPYGQIPRFPVSTAPDHAGCFVFGLLNGVPVALMNGRIHYYEGWTLQETIYPVRVAHLLGVDSMIVTNAAGCVNEGWSAGTLMVIDDHIKFVLDSPLCGQNDERFGARFPDATYCYTPRLRALADEAAQELNVPIKHGIYFYMTGPQYETPAEIRAIRVLGGDAVGMSTVPEVLAARQLGMEVLGFSMLTNMAAGIEAAPLSHDEVRAAAERGRKDFSRLVLECLKRMRNS